jgi:hypothetical protein
MHGMTHNNVPRNLILGQTFFCPTHIDLIEKYIFLKIIFKKVNTGSRKKCVLELLRQTG